MIISTNDHKAAVGKTEHSLMQAAVGPCIAAINACNRNTTGTCLAATELCNAGLLIPYTLTGMNPYDMRVKCAKVRIHVMRRDVERRRETQRDVERRGDIALLLPLPPDHHHHEYIH